ncbi:hypothetical protein PGT21_007737 [Puccinia graminis f. sp. tritici]|nr:hypothetical protein PGT21_007737 [Puccinia graminis f. sp. tritici]
MRQTADDDPEVTRRSLLILKEINAVPIQIYRLRVEIVEGAQVNPVALSAGQPHGQSMAPLNEKQAKHEGLVETLERVVGNPIAGELSRPACNRRLFGTAGDPVGRREGSSQHAHVGLLGSVTPESGRAV